MCDPEIDGPRTVTVLPVQKKLSKLHRNELFKIACDKKDKRHLSALEKFLSKSWRPEDGKIRTLVNIYGEGPGKIILSEYADKIK